MCMGWCGCLCVHHHMCVLSCLCVCWWGGGVLDAYVSMYMGAPVHGCQDGGGRVVERIPIMYADKQEIRRKKL